MDLIAAAARFDVRLSQRATAAPGWTGCAQAHLLELPTCRMRYCIIGEGPLVGEVPDAPNANLEEVERYVDLLLEVDRPAQRTAAA